jgi:hypothetical protein
MKDLILRMFKGQKALKALALAVSILSAPVASAFSLEGTIWSKAPNQTDASLLYAIALTESKKMDASKKTVTPWPWAVHFQNKGYYFDSREEAEAFVTDKIQRGYRNIDIGVMQVNYRWHGHRVKDPMDLFDLATSIRVAEEILLEAMASAPGDIALGVGRYHNWNDPVRSRSYGQTVLYYQSVLNRIAKG